MSSRKQTSPPPSRLLLEQLEERILWDAQPVATIAAPANPLVGESVDLAIQFTNASATEAGYGPYIDLFLPANGADGSPTATKDGLTFNNATYLGQPVTSTVLTFDAAGEALHPYAKDASGNPQVVTGAPGDQLVVLQLPFGSFTPGQPTAQVNVNTSMSNLADVGTPLSVQVRGGFQFGNDALDNPTTDPSLVGPLAGQTITPQLFTLTKEYLGPEDETATGPNFIRQYRLVVDVAEGQTLTGLQLADLLPDTLQFVSLDATLVNGGAVSTTAIATPSTATPGGALTREFASILGTAGADDAEMLFSFYVPRIDGGSSAILDATSGNDVTIDNEASVSADWLALDTRDQVPLGSPTAVSIDPAGPEHTLTAKSIATQKSSAIVVDTGAAGLTPGDTVEFALEVQVSDYFAFQNLVLTDQFSDGLRLDTLSTPTLAWNESGASFGAVAFDAGNYSVFLNADNNPATPATDGSTTITFNISSEMVTRGQDAKLLGGGIPVAGTGTNPLPNNPPLPFGATTLTIRFRAVVQDQFTDTLPSGEAALNPGEVLTNTIQVGGDLLNVTDAATPTGQSESDGSGVSLQTVPATVVKSVYAINGNTNLALFTAPDGSLQVQPNDTVTYRLGFTIPSGDIENLNLADFLPLPIFDSAEVTTFIDTTAPGLLTATAPPAGSAKFGPNETFRFAIGSAPTITPGAANSNSVVFDYGTYSDPTNTEREVDILFTVTVGTEPFADALFLTNVVQASENNTQSPSSPSTSDSIIQIQLNEPNVALYKGVAGSTEAGGLTLGGITFDAPGVGTGFSGGPVADATQAAAIGASDLPDADGGDVVRFALVAQNSGRSDAFDVTLSDAVPAGFAIPASLAAMNFTVRRGDGTLLVDGVDYTASVDGSGNISLQLADAYTSGNVGSETKSGGLSRGFDANTATAITNGSNTIVVTYDLTLSQSAQALSTITNTGTLTNFSSSEGGTDFTTTDPTENASVTVSSPSLAKVLTGSEINNATNSATQAVVGELVTYTLTLTVPEGTTANAVINDTLDAGLAFVDVQSVTTSGGVTVATPIGIGASPANVTVGPGGNTLAFNFGDIVNANASNGAAETITIVYRAVVLNTNTLPSSPGNQSGSTLHNAAQLTAEFTDVPVQPGAPTGYTVNQDSGTQNVTVIEPVLTTDKRVSADNITYTDNLTNVDAGDSVYYRIRLTNPAAGTTAFDLALTDVLPSTLSGLSVVSVAVTNAAGGAGGSIVVTDGGPNTLSTDDFAITGQTLALAGGRNIDLGANSRLEIVVQGTLTTAVVPSQVVGNTAATTWTSLDGTPGARSIHNAASTERTGAGGQGSDAAVLDNYASSDGTNLTIRNPNNAKSIVATSEDFTGIVSGTERVAVGEIVRYRLVIDVPEGTLPDFQVVDALRNGLLFVNDGTATVGFVSNTPTGITSTAIGGAGLYLGSSIASPTFVLPDAAVSKSTTTDNDTWTRGNNPRFKLGDVVNSEIDAGAEFIVIEFNAVVLDITSNQSNTRLRNSFTTRIDGNTTVGAASNNVDVRVAEPNLSVAKTASTAGPLDAGDTFSYTITLANNAAGANAAPAFDVRVLDAVDQILAGNPTAELEFLSYGLGVLPSGTSLLADASSTATDTLDLTFNRLNAGSTITITVNVQVKTGSLAGAEIENKSTVTYTSLPGAAGTTSGALATAYGTTDVDLNPGTDSTLASALAGGSASAAQVAERTGADVPNPTDNSAPSNNGIRNNYAVAAGSPAGLTVQTPSIDKQWQDGSLTADDTSVTTTTAGDAVIGETATYDLFVTLPEGVTQTLRVEDIVPAGLRIDSIQILTAAGSSTLLTQNFDGSFALTPTLGAPLNGPATLSLNFGDATVVDDNIAGNNSFVVRITATVTNIAANQETIARTNTARVVFNDPDGAVNAGPAADRTLSDSNAANDPTVTIVEPTLTVVKTVDSFAADAGDVLTYTLTLSNTSGQVAYDVAIQDILDGALASPTILGGVDFSATGFGAFTAPTEANFEFVTVTAGNLGQFNNPPVQIGDTVLRVNPAFSLDIPDGASVQLKFEATIANSAVVGVDIDNKLSGFWSSLDGTVADERTGSSDPDPSTTQSGNLDNYAVSSSVISTAVAPIVVSKAAIATDDATTPGLDVTLGEVVTYRITVSLPEGTTPKFVIADNLPAGMAYVPGSAILTAARPGGAALNAVHPGSGTAAINATGLAAPTVTPGAPGDGTDITFTFSGPIVVSGDNNLNNNTFFLTYQAVVLDVAGNSGLSGSQTSLNNTLGYEVRDAGDAVTISGSGVVDPVGTTVTVIEPLLTATKAVAVNGAGTSGDAGDPITYTIVLDHAGTSLSDAFDVTFSDTLPSQIGATTATPITIADVTVNHSTLGDITALFEVVGGVLRTQSGLSFDLDLADSVTVTVNGVLVQSLAPGTAFNNAASIAYSSRDGDLTAGGGFNPNSNVTTDQERIRTGNTNTVTVTVPSALTLSKSIIATSETGAGASTGSDLAVGETATYRLNVTIEDGTTALLTLSDATPSGLRYQAGTAIFRSADGVTATGFVTNTVYTNGDTINAADLTDSTSDTAIGSLVFRFKNLVAPATVGPDTDAFQVDYTLLAANVLANQAGPKNNSATAAADRNGDGDTTDPGETTAPATAPATIVEPVLALDKIVVGGPLTAVEAGDTFQYTVSVDHTAGSTATAFDLILTDIADAKLEIISIDSVGGTNALGLGTGDFTIAGTGGGNSIALNANPDLATTDDFTVTYTVRALIALEPNEVLTNDVALTWSGIDGVNANERTGVSPNIQGDGSLDDYRLVDSASVTGAGTFDLTKAITNGTNFTVGEEVEYELQLTVIRGTTDLIAITDTLPGALGFAAGSLTVESDGMTTGFVSEAVSASYVAGTRILTINLGTVTNPDDANDNTITIRYRALVENDLANQNAAPNATKVNDADATAVDAGGNPLQDLDNTATATVVEPVLTLDKSVVGGPITNADAGDTFQFTVAIDHAGTSASVAYDLVFGDTVDADLEIISIDSIGGTNTLGLTTGDFAIVGAGGGNSISLVSDADLGVNDDFSITYTVRILNSATPGDILGNDTSVTWSSLDGAVATERTGTAPNILGDGSLDDYRLTDAASITTDTTFDLVKSADKPTAAVGETITYTLSLTLNEGTTQNVVLTDLLPVSGGKLQLEFVAGSAAIAFGTAGTTISGSATPTVSGALNENLTFTLGDIVLPPGATPDTVTITYDVVVMNVATNQAGDVETNSASGSATNVAPDTGNTTNVTLTEPVLTLAKVTTTAGTDAGDPVAYTLTVTNAAGPTVSTAYDINVLDLLDTDIALVNALVGAGQGIVVAGATVTANASTTGQLDITLDQLAAGASATITLNAQVKAGAVSGSTVSNAASLTYTSTPGVNPDERTGGGGTDDYSDSATSADFVLATPVIDKLTPADTTYAIGESVTYDILVTIPEGTTNGLVITDNLPAGLVYTGLQVVTTAAASGGLLGNDFDGTVTGTPTVGNPSGNTRTFDFAAVTVNADADNLPANNTFLLRVTARVGNILTNQGAGSPAAATTFSNTASLQYTDGSSGSTTVTDPTAPGAISVVEPVMSLDKTALSATTGLDAGDTIQYQVTFGNTGTSTAHDVALADVLPAGLTVTSIDNTTPAGGATVDTAVAGVGTGVLSGEFTIPVGGSVVVIYTVTLDNTVTPGTNYTNAAAITYSSIDGVDPDERVGTAPNVQNDGSVDDYRLTDAVTATTDATFDLVKSTPATEAAIGDTITYTLTLTLNEGTTQNVVLTDLLPLSGGELQFEFVAGSATIAFGTAGTTISGSATPAVSGTLNENLTFTLGDIVLPAGATADTVTITYDVVVTDVTSSANGDTLANSADGSATDVPPDTGNTTNVTVIEPQLTITKGNDDADSEVTLGQTVEYTLTVANLAANGSTADAYDLIIRDTLPAGLQFVGFTTVPAGFAASESSGVLTLTGPSLALGGSLEVKYTAIVTLAATGNLENNTRLFYDSQAGDEGALPGQGNTVFGDTDGTTGDRDYGAAPGVEVFNVDTDPAQDTERVTVGTGVISDLVFFDANANNVFDGQDVGLPGVTVWVDLNGDGVFDATEPGAVTDANGLYAIGGLAAGTYQTRVLTTSLPDGGATTATFDVDGTPDGIANGVTLASGQTRTDVDFGYAGTGTAGDLIWNDIDGNGVVSGSELGVPGVTVDLVYDVNGDGIDVGDPVVASTTTDPNGLYTFSNLLSGNYRAVVTDTGNVLAGSTETFDLDGLATLNAADFGMAVGQMRGDVDFGYRGGASLGDRVWNDLNGNAAQDAGEPGIAGLGVDLYRDLNGNGSLTDPGDGLIATTVTGANGAYLFDGLLGGNYVAIVTSPPPSAAATFDLDGVGTPDAAARTLGASEGATDVDFGYLGAASIGDYMWFDRNGDGVQDATEPPLPGVTVFLDIDGNGAFDAATEPSATTAADGSYAITGLVGGNYTARVLGSTLPAGAVATSDLDGAGTPGAATFALGATQARGDVDYGYTGSFAVGGRVYHDTDVDSSFGGTDTGLGGVTVELFWDTNDDGAVDAGDFLLTSLTTNPDGTYNFGNLIAGNYLVREIQPAGYASSEAPADLLAPTVVNADVTGQNFGDTTGSIAGRVFQDDDNSGAQNGTEAGIAGVQVALEWSGADGVFGNGDDRSAVTTTDGAGDWVFDFSNTGGFVANGDSTSGLLSTGLYRIVETQPGAFLDGAEAAGNAAVNAGGVLGAGSGRDGSDQIGVPGDSISIAPGQQAGGYTFGELLPASISGRVYSDTDVSDSFDPGEPGIAGATVTLTGTDDLGNPVNIVTVTNSLGDYTFTNLRPGTYVLTETQPAGFLDGRETAGSKGGNVSTDDVISAIPIVPGDNAAGYHFGEVAPSSLAGFVFDDSNRNGVRDGGEPGLGGVAIQLTGTDARGNAVTLTGTTAADGSYRFTNLVAGTYQIRETQPVRYADGQDRAGSVGGAVQNDLITAIPLGTRQNGINYNFGELSAQILGTVFVDADKDGTPDPFDPGLAGVEVSLFDANGSLVATTTTGADGSYLFENLPSGDYTVIESQPGGYGSSTSNIVPVNVPPGSANRADFGETTGSVNGVVFEDRNNNGVRDGNEAGIGGATVRLVGTDVNGRAIDVLATTAADGSYVFSGLLAGTYSLVETQPSGFLDGNDAAGTFGGSVGNDVVSGIVVGAGVDGLGYTFGELIPATVSGFVFVDVNGNGVQDAGEQPLAGVAITLTGTDDRGNRVSLTTVTDSDGAYRFENLRPGTYTLVEIQPEGFEDGPDILGSQGGTVGDDRLTFTLNAGVMGVGNNFVEANPALFFAYDSYNNFADTSRSFFTDGFRKFTLVDNPYAERVPPLLTLMPIYTGVAEPGSTLVIELLDERGQILGSRTVIADAGTNWLATFPAATVYEEPHAIRVTQRPPVFASDAVAPFNLRTYFAPPLHGSVFASTELTVRNVVEGSTAVMVHALYEGISNPLALDWRGFHYEFLGSSGLPSGQ